MCRKEKRGIWVCGVCGEGRYKGPQSCFFFQSPKWKMLMCFQKASRDEICDEVIMSVKMGENVEPVTEYLKCLCKNSSVSFELLNDQLPSREKTLHILGHYKTCQLQ